MTRRRRVDVNLDELDQIIDRSQRAPLSESEGEKLKTALHAMAERLQQKRSTEKTSAVLPQDSAATGTPETSESAPAGHGRNPAAAFRGANKVAVAHPTLHSGDRCPECRRGKLYHQKESATLVRFVGHAPLEATVFEMERLRCNACGEVFTADEPETAGAAKYDETAVAMIALLKYGTGVPFNRLERLQGQLGMPLPAATQWELMAAAAKPLRLALEELIRQAAQGRVMHNDDTSMRILRLIREPDDKRTGTFTSGIISLVGGWTIALFFTGRKHAGENIAEVLKHRAHELPAPIQMCDALSRNTPKGVETLIANCLAHGRRQVVEVVDHFPEECRYVLETLGGVYHNDAVSRERELSPEDRLRFHQEHSGPLMKGLHEWMEAQLAEHKTEPNSGLGKAISYLLNHWTKLTLFLRQPGSPIDNNIVERSLKKAILNRRNALFYKTLNGAGVGDLFMSLIHTCELNGANPFDYLTELQRHAEELKRCPSEWMPWNYRETLARLATLAAA
jgi:transposase